MKLLHHRLTSSEFSGCPLPADTVLFDIETTGLSADTSYLYLIGAVYAKEEELTLTQWFCDEYSEEKEVLSSFLSFLENFRTLVHYNGTGFDIPYLNKKFKRHRLCAFIRTGSMQETPAANRLSGILETVDIYKQLLPFRKFTSFPDFKQNTLEKACGFYRTDTFSGADLIEVYAAYAGKSRLAALTGNTEEADALRHVLLLHNHDDLLGLLHLSNKTHLTAFKEGRITPSVLKLPDAILFSFDFPLLPFALSLTLNGCTLTVSEQATDLCLPLYEGELKYFFKDYKNYSYLKYEDTAVHNSVAAWVDKDAKEKCRPDTSYQKKSGAFLALPFAKPAHEAVLEGAPLFFHRYKTLPAYVEYADSLVCSREFITACFRAFLSL